MRSDDTNSTLLHPEFFFQVFWSHFDWQKQKFWLHKHVLGMKKKFWLQKYVVGYHRIAFWTTFVCFWHLSEFMTTMNLPAQIYIFMVEQLIGCKKKNLVQKFFFLGWPGSWYICSGILLWTSCFFFYNFAI